MKVVSKWLTGRLRSTPIHTGHGSTEAGSITLRGLPEEAVRSFERAMRMSPVDPLLHRLAVGMAMAFIELRRFDEAIVAGKKALRQHPSFASAYRCLASAFAHLGRDAEAREAAARLQDERMFAGLIKSSKTRSGNRLICPAE